jgi:hypothetical protein
MRGAIPAFPHTSSWHGTYLRTETTLPYRNEGNDSCLAKAVKSLNLFWRRTRKYGPKYEKLLPFQNVCHLNDGTCDT